MVKTAFCCSQHPETNWEIHHLSVVDGTEQQTGQRTTASFVPDIGCNLLGLKVDQIDYLYGVGETPEGPTLLGTPILYPTPNRVRNGTFTFDQRTFTFPANNGDHFIHGLVRDVPWKVDKPQITDQGISVTARVVFEPGNALYERFPIANTLELTYRLRPRSIRLAFAVHNDDPTSRLPFGLAIHPYFPIIGSRDSVRIQVPAQKWMEAENLIPTGRLLDLDDAPANLNQPTSLQDLDLDDVYWGADPEHPQVIYYDEIGKKVTLRASDIFTHCVVYTPPGQPYFCIENQSCSTDAHNLDARGEQEAAHLIILNPGESATGSIEMTVSDQ